MVNLIVTDSLYNTFNCLGKELKDVGRIENRNIIFCEDKMSLMLEKYICDANVGSFSTDVISFAKFLNSNKKFEKVLTKESSAMVVKRVLMNNSLKRFNRSSNYIAPTLSELIAQLKSANVSVMELEDCVDKAKGVLRDKLEDIITVYREYDKQVQALGYVDQYTAFSYLPKVIEESEDVKQANVFVVGLTSFTVQIREVIKSLIKVAKNVTAILVGGENKFAFVNETPQIFREICYELKQGFGERKESSPYSEEGKLLTQNMFNPLCFRKKRIDTEKVKVENFESVDEEVTRIAQIIKQKVMSEGVRYKNFVLAVPDVEKYKDSLRHVFNMLEIPYYLDENKIALSHPLVGLIIAYIEMFRKNFDRESVKAFYRNILVVEDKELCDDFENYTLKYNVDYGRIRNSFTFSDKTYDEKLEKLERMRAFVCSFFDEFNVKATLEKLGVEQKLNDYTQKLSELGLVEESAVNQQIYKSTVSVIDQIEGILNQEKIELYDYKSIFISGISALKLSIIPQYNDAVFIGDFKQCSVSQADYLFVLGLTSSVPQVKEDVALLSDNDINELKDIKVLVEPKIKVVNHRTRESATLSISAFRKRLYLSYPTSETNGGKTVKSEMLNYVNALFNTQKFEKGNAYLTEKQGYNSFSIECGEFVNNKRDDFVDGSSFYEIDKKGKCERIANSANQEIKIRLENNRQVLLRGIVSPTGIEDYYNCPYRSFVKHGLKVSERKESKVDGSFVGTLMHDVFKEYVGSINQVKDEQTSNALVDKLCEKVLQDNKYKSMKSDVETSYSLDNALVECKEYCYKTFLTYQNSQFKCEKDGAEVYFGDKGNGRLNGGCYPAISLLNGKVKLSGKIDRIDTCGDYFRIVDYKTGLYHLENQDLFNGTGLQLYLYSAVVKDKQLVGAYYLPITKNYSAESTKFQYVADGKTLDDEKTIRMQDVTFEEKGSSEFFNVKKKGEKISGTISKQTFDSMIEYALSVSELASQQMCDGVIVGSPVKKDDKCACNYCEFYSMCNRGEQTAREVRKVKDELFVQVAQEKSQTESEKENVNANESEKERE